MNLSLAEIERVVPCCPGPKRLRSDEGRRGQASPRPAVAVRSDSARFVGWTAVCCRSGPRQRSAPPATQWIQRGEHPPVVGWLRLCGELAVKPGRVTPDVLTRLPPAVRRREARPACNGWDAAGDNARPPLRPRRGGRMNTWICGCRHPAGRTCLYCVALDPPAPRSARRWARRHRLLLQGSSRRARP